MGCAFRRAPVAVGWVLSVGMERARAQREDADGFLAALHSAKTVTPPGPCGVSDGEQVRYPRYSGASVCQGNACHPASRARREAVPESASVRARAGEEDRENRRPRLRPEPPAARRRGIERVQSADSRPWPVTASTHRGSGPAQVVARGRLCLFVAQLVRAPRGEWRMRDT